MSIIVLLLVAVSDNCSSSVNRRIFSPAANLWIASPIEVACLNATTGYGRGVRFRVVLFLSACFFGGLFGAFDFGILFFGTLFLAVALDAGFFGGCCDGASFALSVGSSRASAHSR
jgi:hypothetical protein